MFFFNLSKISQDYLGKNCKSVLIECWFLFFFWDKDEWLILKITIENITKTCMFWEISEIRIFKRNNWEVNEIHLKQMLLARKDIIKEKKHNQVWFF